MSKKHSRSEQARINGAKSRGPVTIEGKARSSVNALKHGFASVINVVLRVEDKVAFQSHTQRLHDSYKPKDYAEECYVDQLAAITWRQVRLLGLETALLDAQMGFQNDEVKKLAPQAANDPYFHLVHAWQSLARPAKNPNLPDAANSHDGYDINSLDLLRRYQLALDRQHRNTLLNLRYYRQHFGPEPTGSNEPKTKMAGPPKEETSHAFHSRDRKEAGFPPFPLEREPQRQLQLPREIRLTCDLPEARTTE